MLLNVGSRGRDMGVPLYAKKKNEVSRHGYIVIGPDLNKNSQIAPSFAQQGWDGRKGAHTRWALDAGEGRDERLSSRRMA